MLPLQSDTGGLSGIIDAVDSGWGLAALFLIGLYLLIWRFASQILEVVRDSRDRTADVQNSIITNHGSQNLGDAVDRLTTRVMFMQDNQGADRSLMRSLARDLERHIEECRRIHQPGQFIVKEETTDEPRQ